jgi:hypothetical protein
MFDQRGYEAIYPEYADDFPDSDPGSTVPARGLTNAEINRLYRSAVRDSRGKKARTWHHSDIDVTLTPPTLTAPTPEELREMVGCVDHDEAERQRRLRLLETGLRRRHPSLTDGRLEAAVARVTRALSPPPPPSDSDWEGIRRRRVSAAPPATTRRGAGGPFHAPVQPRTIRT